MLTLLLACWAYRPPEVPSILYVMHPAIPAAYYYQTSLDSQPNVRAFWVYDHQTYQHVFRRGAFARIVNERDRSAVYGSDARSQAWILIKDCGTANCEAYATELSKWFGTELDRVGTFVGESPIPSSETAPTPFQQPITTQLPSNEAINSVIQSEMSQIRECYLKALYDIPTIGGLVKIRFVISKEGSVSSAEVIHTTMNRPDTESCIAERIQSLKLQEPTGGGIIVVNYPFIFSP